MKEDITLADIKITISLEEYINRFCSSGGKFLVVDKNRAAEIMAQNGWESSVYFEPMLDGNGEIAVYKLWRLKDWEWSKSTKLEHREETRQLNMIEARKKHEALEKWKKEARLRIMKTGKIPENKVESYLQRCISPKVVTMTVCCKCKDTHNSDCQHDITTAEQVIIPGGSIDFKLREALGFPSELA